MADSGEFVTFHISGEEYGIDVMKVREISIVSEVTRIPNMPPYVKGVMNLRGTIVPVFELRVKLGFPPVEYGERAALIILDLEEGTSGILVETIGDVEAFRAADLQTPKERGLEIDTDMVDWIGCPPDRMVMILNIDRVFSQRDLPKPA